MSDRIKPGTAVRFNWDQRSISPDQNTGVIVENAAINDGFYVVRLDTPIRSSPITCTLDIDEIIVKSTDVSVLVPFSWPLRFARAKGGRCYHLVEYDGTPPMGVRNGVAICGAAPMQWHAPATVHIDPDTVPWYTCTDCGKIARERNRSV